MIINNDGTFTYTITHEGFCNGYAPFPYSMRNKGHMTECIDFREEDLMLYPAEQRGRYLPAFSYFFPFPQVFVFDFVTIICNQKEIYEKIANSYILKYTTNVAASSWECINVGQFCLLSNGHVILKRDPVSLTYEELDDVPTGMSLCNYNAQILIGSPNGGY